MISFAWSINHVSPLLILVTIQFTHGLRLYLKLRGLATEKFKPYVHRRCLALIADQQHRRRVQSRLIPHIREPRLRFSDPATQLVRVISRTAGSQLSHSCRGDVRHLSLAFFGALRSRMERLWGVNHEKPVPSCASRPRTLFGPEDQKGGDYRNQKTGDQAKEKEIPKSHTSRWQPTGWEAHQVEAKVIGGSLDSQ